MKSDKESKRGTLQVRRQTPYGLYEAVSDEVNSWHLALRLTHRTALCLTVGVTPPSHCGQSLTSCTDTEETQHRRSGRSRPVLSASADDTPRGRRGHVRSRPDGATGGAPLRTAGSRPAQLAPPLDRVGLPLCARSLPHCWEVLAKMMRRNLTSALLYQLPSCESLSVPRLQSDFGGSCLTAGWCRLLGAGWGQSSDPGAWGGNQPRWLP